MRYIKLLILVLIFFFVMMFFVQNQAAFSAAITLGFDPIFLPRMESAPMPIYTLMLLCFITGAMLVLLMLMWDRIMISGRLTSARHKIASLEKKLEKSAADLEAAAKNHAAAEEKLKTALADAEARIGGAFGSQVKAGEK